MRLLRPGTHQLRLSWGREGGGKGSRRIQGDLPGTNASRDERRHGWTDLHLHFYSPSPTPPPSLTSKRGQYRYGYSSHEKESSRRDRECYKS